MRGNVLLSKIKSQYDKIIACIVLGVLLVSLVYLAVQMGMMRKWSNDFKEELSQLKPTNPVSSPVDTSVFDAKVESLNLPYTIPYGKWTNQLFVPESRVWCVDCGRPIRFSSLKCGFCNVDQPPVQSQSWVYDSDGDGIPNLWELKFGRDPNDPNDVSGDGDGDGFSDIVEFNAAPHTDLRDPSVLHGTDMNNPDSYPPVEELLFVEKMGANPFMLRFKSTMTTPDGKKKFGLNLKEGRKTRTLWGTIGDSVEGFVIVSCEYKIKEVSVGGGSTTLKKDVSVLTLKKGDKTIPLIYNQDVQYNEYVVRLIFKLDNSRYTLRVGDKFKLKGKDYLLNAIDTVRESVVITRMQDSSRMVRPKFSGAENAVSGEEQ